MLLFTKCILVHAHTVEFSSQAYPGVASWRKGLGIGLAIKRSGVLLHNDSEQVLHTFLSLPPSSIIW